MTVKLSKRVLQGIEEHHKTCLRECFDCHYEPLANGRKNRAWVTGLSPQTKTQIRLHLCVVLRGDILDWTDEEVGKKSYACTQSVSYTHLTLPTNREV